MYSGIGRLASDVIVLTKSKGKESFTVSNNTVYFKEKIGMPDVPFDVVFFNGANTYLQKKGIKKGDMIFVEGFFKNHIWTDSEDRLHHKVRLIVTRLHVFEQKDSTIDDDDFFFQNTDGNFLDY